MDYVKKNIPTNMYALWQFFFQRLFRHIVAATETQNLPKEPVILASNHIDWLDGLLLAVLVWHATKRKTAFLARTRNWQIFDTKMIKVDQPLEAITNDIATRITKGDCIGIFPEGYRNTEQELAKGKVGAVRFALENNIPILPVGIQGKNHPSAIAAFLDIWKNPPRFFFGTPRTYHEYKGRENDKQLLDQLTTELMVDIGRISHKPYPYT